VEGIRAVRHRAGVTRSAEGRELALEQTDVLALDVGARREDARDGLLDLRRMRASWAFRSMMGIARASVTVGPSYRRSARRASSRLGASTSGCEAASASRFGNPPGMPTARAPADLAIARPRAVPT